MLRRPLLAWLLLLALLAAEIGFAALPVWSSQGAWSRCLLLLPAAAMAALIAGVFMEVGRAPVIARGFALAGLVWLGVLLGLGSMDKLTRTNHPVGSTQHERP